MSVCGCFCTDVTPVLLFFLTETESSGLQPGVNDGMLRWTRRLMQEKSDNQSLDQPRAGESLLCLYLDRCRLLPRVRTAELPQTVCCTSVSFSVGVGDTDTICCHSGCVMLYHRQGHLICYHSHGIHSAAILLGTTTNAVVY